MAATIGKYAASKFMSKQAKQDQATRLEDGRDPYWYLETDKHGRTKKRPKKSAKHYPSYIPLADRERLNSFRSWAKFMDTALFGQVGASFFVGLVPVAGDFADGGIAWLLVQKYANTISCGLPKKVYAQMMSNITIDVAIGMIPVLGDIADAVYKANVKNLIILEDYLKKVFAPSQGGTPVKRVAEVGMDGGLGGPGVDDGVRRPDAVASKKSNGGWFQNMTGGGSRRDRERDVERSARGHETRGQDARYDSRPDSRPDRRQEMQETGTTYGARR